MENSSYFTLGKHWGLPSVPAHALLMTVCWSIVLPAGAVYVRYFGLNRNAVWIHAAVQLVGTCLVLVAAGLILLNGTKASAIQQISGWPVFVVVVCSLLSGIRQLYFRGSPSALPSAESRRRGRVVHGMFGLVGILFAYGNLPQGNHLVAPLGEKPLHPLWILFFASSIGWITTVVYLERRRRTQTAEWLSPDGRHHSLEVVKYDSVIDLPSVGSTTVVVSDRLQPVQPYSVQPPVPSAALPAEVEQARVKTQSTRFSTSTNGLPCYTWSELNDIIVNDGKQWVVSSGGLVVDVARWLTTHPGGQQVLKGALGTSVEFDMFPTNPPPLAKLTKGEWSQVLATRRTNTHSSVAQSKMQSMVVGRLHAPANVFDPLEYRRYALIHKSYLSSTPAAFRSTILFRFAELYPSASSSPAFLLPGHVVEIRMRVPKLQLRKLETQSGRQLNVPKSGWISRFYTPLDGNMSCFSVAIKLLPSGTMSHLLDDLDPSHTPQIQIRGPMGTPLVNPGRPLPIKNGCWDHLIFLCAGSGASPAWQYINWMFLNHDFPGTMLHATGMLPQDARVAIKGWANTNAGTVSVSSTKGDLQVPLSTLLPWVGSARHLSIVLVEEDLESIMGRGEMEAIANAYPSQATIRYRVKQPSTHPQATMGRATEAYVKDMVTQLADGTDGTPMIVAIGPQRFLSTVNDAMDGYPDDKLLLLPPHMYLSLPYSPTRPLLTEGGEGSLQIRRSGANGEPLWFYDE